MGRMVQLTDETSVPLKWLVLGATGLVALLVPPLLAWAELKHDVRRNTRDIRDALRDARYAAEDSAWVRGKLQGEAFEEIKRQRRLEEQATGLRSGE